MKTKIVFLLYYLSLSCLPFKDGFSQTNPSKIVCVAFYNLENLFDTQLDTTINDEEFTPNGAKHWTLEKYHQKLQNLAKVISELGKPQCKEGPILLGLSEIENRTVLRELLEEDKLAREGFQIIHYDSKDGRGVDVALFYKPKYFKVISSDHFPVYLQDSINGSKYTRDVLLVKGELLNQTIYVTVNHWPSRRGGTAASEPYRRQVARLNYHLFDSISRIEANPAFIVMGDLNDNPNNHSIKHDLKAHQDKEYVVEGSFYNPFFKSFKDGKGSLAYNDAWSLFDQIILSYRFLHPDHNGLEYDHHEIFNRDYLLETEGHYKNHPKRSFTGDDWNNGYSDHLPAILYLKRNN